MIDVEAACAETVSGRCETRRWNDGLPCGRPARWIVQVGARQFDQQVTCPQHLSMTVQALMEAERPRIPVIIVKARWLIQ